MDNPFNHSNIKTKDDFISFARKMDLEKLSEALASTLIYFNTVDYIAKFLLESFNKTANIFSDIYFDSSINFCCCFENPLGINIKLLEKYDFSGKVEILEPLGKFNQLRTKYAHKLFTITPTDFGKIKEDMYEIKELGEEIIRQFNLINFNLYKKFSKIKTN